MTAVTCTVALHAKFNGLFWKMNMVDIDESKNIKNEELNDIPLLTKILQQYIDDMKKEGKSIPPPKFKKYVYFESSYGIDPIYHDLTVCI